MIKMLSKMRKTSKGQKKSRQVMSSLEEVSSGEKNKAGRQRRHFVHNDFWSNEGTIGIRDNNSNSQ